MLKNIIIIVLVIILSYFGFWYISARVSHKLPEQEEQQKEQAQEEQQKEQAIKDSEPSEAQETAVLDLSNKGISELPKFVLSRKDLRVLDISGNSLTGALPAEIRHLSNLEKLDASNNQMTGIPAEIGQLKKLRILDYSNNQITGLPLEIGNLQNLEILNLSGNDYSQFDLDKIKEKLPDLNIISE